MPAPIEPPQHPASGHARGTPEYRRIVTGAWCAGLAALTLLYGPQGALPWIAESLRVSPATAALSVSAATLGLMLGVVPWSMAADRWGRLRTMSIALIGAITISLIAPWMPGLPLFLIARGVAGFLVGAVPAIALAYLSDRIRPSDMTRAAGIYIAGTTLGGLLGRIVAGQLSVLIEWRWGQLAVTVLGGVAALIFIQISPSDRLPASPRRPDVGHRVSIGRRITGLLRSPPHLALYAQGFLLMGGFVTMYNYVGFHLAGPPLLVPASLISLIFLAYVSGTWTSTRVGNIIKRFGQPAALLGSTAIMTIGVILTLVPLVPTVVLGIILLTGGFFGAHTTASSWTAAISGHDRALAGSLYNLFYYGGSSLFGWAGGLLFQSLGWPGPAGMVLCLTVVAAITAALVLVRPRHCALP